jgi:hypothetical protein
MAVAMIGPMPGMTAKRWLERLAITWNHVIEEESLK